MMSDQQIAETLDSLLRSSNPNSFSSFNDVVQQLESKLGLGLSTKVDLISTQIQLFCASQQHRPSPPPPQQQAQLLLHQSPPSIPHNHPHPKDHFAPIQSSNFVVRCPEPLQPTPALKAEPNDIAASDAAKQSARVGTKRKGGPGGLTKLCGVSPELQTIVGQPELPRTEIVKQLWAYIRKNNLQDPSNKRKINCNDELRLVFETDCTDMFKMNKLLAKHIITLEPSKQTGQHSKKEKANLTQSIEPGPLVIISEVLANFFGTSGMEMPQSEVLGRISEYIKANHLEDPLDPMMVLCDVKLQGLLGCESISAQGIPEMLARHHLFKKL